MNQSTVVRILLSTALLGGLLLGACGDDETASAPPCDAAFPETAAESVVYVAPSCAGDAADGTKQRPFGSIQEALDGASEDTTIVIEPGSYAENLRVQTSGITLLGSTDGVTPQDAAVVLNAPDQGAAAIWLQDAGDAVIQGIQIVTPGVAGIWLQRGALTVKDTLIEGATGTADGAFGFGLLAEEPAGIWLQRSAITGSASTGVMIHGSTGELSIQDNTIDGNARGGIRVESHADGGLISGNNLTGNFESGIALLSVVGIWLQNNGVHDTKAGGPAMSADGVLIAELRDADGVSFGNSEVIVGGDESESDQPLGNQLTGNGRVGLLLSGDVSGVIVANDSDSNARAGIWLQDSAGMKAGIWLQSQAKTGIWLQDHHAEAGIWLQNNGARGNSFVGISVGAGARASIISNEVADTQAGQMIEPGGIGTISMGDGVGLFAGSEARVESNVLSGNSRLGILGDSLSSDSVIEGNEFLDNAAGSVAIQGASSGEMPTGQDIDGVESSAAGSYSVMPESNDPNGFSSGTIGMAPGEM